MSEPRAMATLAPAIAYHNLSGLYNLQSFTAGSRTMSKSMEGTAARLASDHASTIELQAANLASPGLNLHSLRCSNLKSIIRQRVLTSIPWRGKLKHLQHRTHYFELLKCLRVHSTLALATLDDKTVQAKWRIDRCIQSGVFGPLSEILLRPMVCIMISLNYPSHPSSSPVPC